MPNTYLGYVEDRHEREPAPLECASCKQITMHSFSRRTDLRQSILHHHQEHEFYRCDVCGLERIWG